MPPASGRPTPGCFSSTRNSTTEAASRIRLSSRYALARVPAAAVLGRQTRHRQASGTLLQLVRLHQRAINRRLLPIRLRCQPTLRCGQPILSRCRPILRCGQPILSRCRPILGRLLTNGGRGPQIVKRLAAIPGSSGAILSRQHPLRRRDLPSNQLLLIESNQVDIIRPRLPGRQPVTRCRRQIPLRRALIPRPTGEDPLRCLPVPMHG
jgi:hypothetical protein